MKSVKILKLICFVAIIFMLENKCAAQDSATIADAKAHLEAGLSSYNKKDYSHAIDYFLVSISEVPTTLTYYSLTSAYAKNGDPSSALQYANMALNASPRLETKYYNQILKIKAWATKELNETVTLSGDALKRKPTMDFDVAMPSTADNPFSEKEAEAVPSNSVFENKVVYSTNQAQYRASVFDNNNNIVGYIIFFGFTNGRNINGQGIASTFSIPLRRVIDATNMEWGKIEYKVNELYAGSVKTETIGRIAFKTIIISVKKYDANNYYLNSITVQVNASVQE